MALAVVGLNAWLAAACRSPFFLSLALRSGWLRPRIRFRHSHVILNNRNNGVGFFGCGGVLEILPRDKSVSRAFVYRRAVIHSRNLGVQISRKAFHGCCGENLADQPRLILRLALSDSEGLSQEPLVLLR